MIRRRNRLFEWRADSQIDDGLGTGSQPVPVVRLQGVQSQVGMAANTTAPPWMGSINDQNMNVVVCTKEGDTPERRCGLERKDPYICGVSAERLDSKRVLLPPLQSDPLFGRDVHPGLDTIQVSLFGPPRQ